MKRKDIEAIVRGLSKGVQEHIAELFAPLVARNADLEKRLAALEGRPEPVIGKDGVNGKDGAAGRDGVNGKDADPAAIAALLAPVLERIVADHIARLPTPAAGKDGAPGAAGRDGANGKDADPAEIAGQLAPVLERIVADHIARVPMPAGKDGAPGAAGRDGVNGKDADPAEIAGQLAPVLERVVADHIARLPTPTAGKDGAPGPAGRDGVAGKDADPAAVAAQLAPVLENIVSDHIARLPVPAAGKEGPAGPAGRDGKDGRDGRDGKDADMNVAVELVRNEMTRQLAALEKVKGDPGVSLVDVGVYALGTAYVPMNVATYGGSLWICQEPTQDKPGTSKAWRLAVKCGRDGRDADPKDIAKAVAETIARMKIEGTL